MIRTYVFDEDRFEMEYGLCMPSDYYLMHIFDDALYVGSIKHDGSFTIDHKVATGRALVHHWTLFV